MDGTSEVGALEVKKKSKKRKDRDGDLGTRKDEAELSNSAPDTVAEVLSSVDMRNNSSEKKEKHTSRKEKAEKNTSGLDLKDAVNDHKRVKNSQIRVEEAGSNVVEHIEPVSDRKKKRKEDLREDISHDSEIHAISHLDNDRVSGSRKKKKDKAATTVSSEGDRTVEIIETVPSNKDAKTEKKNKYKGNSSALENVENSTNENSGESNTEKDVNSHTKNREKVTENCTSKVRFSGQDEVFSGSSEGMTGKNDGLIRGKRFSKEEDTLVEKAVLDYIESHQLGEQGVHMVMNCMAYPELKHCWKQIGASIPWRPALSVYHRAHVLFERGQARKWTEEELELVRKFHQQHGANWKALAEQLGRHRRHIRATWQRIKLLDRKTGGWSQDEYQSLFDLVNMDLSLKAFQDKKSKHGMLKDNICWEAISEKLATRVHESCCRKWYHQLSSPLVAQGEWSDTDDYRLLIALVELDAPCQEEVDWDDLPGLEHRDGEICRKRWRQMVLHIGDNAIKPFNQQVEILANRYCPHLLQPREAYANKPYVDL